MGTRTQCYYTCNTAWYNLTSARITGINIYNCTNTHDGTIDGAIVAWMSVRVAAATVWRRRTHSLSHASRLVVALPTNYRSIVSVTRWPLG